MKNKPNLALAGFAAAMFLIMLFFAFMWEAAERRASQPPVADTTIIVTLDSMAIQGTAVRPDADTLIRIDSIPYPVPVPYPVIKYADGEKIIVHDTIEVYLAREHRLFSVPDTCDIWYSGVDPSLDSIHLYNRHTTEIIKQQYEVQVPKQPLLTLDLGIGNHQWQQLDPYVFARATVAAGKWKIEPYAGYTYSQQPMFGVSVSRSLVLIK